MQGEQVSAAGPGGDAGRSTDKGFALRPAGERNDHPFARFPGPPDVVLEPVVLESVIDAVGGPEQCELAQGCEVADPEVVGECGVYLLGRVHVAVRKSAPKGLS